MKNIAYSIFVSIHSAFNNKKILIIIILSYYFGLLMPFYCLANIEVFMNSLNTIEVTDSKNTYIVTISALQGDDYIKFEESLTSLELKCFTAVTSFQAKMQIGNISSKVSVTGVGANFDTFEKIEMIEGTFPPKENDGEVTECVIAHSISKKYDLHLGDKITINGIAYEISGIVNNFNYYKSIYIPLSSIPITGDSMQHKFYLSYFELPTINQVRLQIALLYPNQPIYSIGLASDIAKKTFKTGYAQSATILLVGTISIIIAMLNTFLIISGKYEDNKRAIATKLALGATKQNISTEIFFENIFFVYVSNFILLITRPLLLHLVPLNSDFSFSWRVHLILLGISTIVAICMSIMIKNKVTKTALSVLLRGE